MNGIFVVDKPTGVTSYDVVRKLKRVLFGVKIGYLGTLDPLATGVLPILLGEGTKLAPFLETGQKVYEATLHLGVITDTQDREGQILQSVDVGAYDLSPHKIEEVIGRFRGRIMQLPPMYSALKQKGEPLYKLARRGEEVERARREVEIYALQVTEIAPPYLHLHIECSKGTYIRTVAHDIGGELGCGAHLAELRRMRSGPFCLEDALFLDDIEGLLNTGRLQERIIPLSEAMGFLPAVEVGEADALQIRNGQVIALEGLHHRSEEDGQVVRVLASKGGGLVAVGGIQREKEGLVLRPLRVFHDVIFTKRPSCARDTMHNMADQGGR
ncbi:MAG: tRNA pseudouridine(55) synthase TruB [Deltaproteobacteria bacterium RBG_13_52_11]|nr:MAG: tRNA pseudouridine(55) synthase TruB [Deltaproteobacteria bacterium RBG_13_52_11]